MTVVAFIRECGAEGEITTDIEGIEERTKGDINIGQVTLPGKRVNVNCDQVKTLLENIHEIKDSFVCYEDGRVRDNNRTGMGLWRGGWEMEKDT